MKSLALGLLLGLVGVNAVDRLSCQANPEAPCKEKAPECGCNSLSTGHCTIEATPFEDCVEVESILGVSPKQERKWDLLEDASDDGGAQGDYRFGPLCPANELKKATDAFECVVTGTTVETFDGMRYSFDGGASSVYTLFQLAEAGGNVANQIHTVQQVNQGGRQGFAFVYGESNVYEILYDAANNDLMTFHNYDDWKLRGIPAFNPQATATKLGVKTGITDSNVEPFVNHNGEGFRVTLTFNDAIQSADMVFTSSGGVSIRLVATPANNGIPIDFNVNAGNRNGLSKGLCGNMNRCSNDDLVIWGSFRDDGYGYLPEILCPNADSTFIAEYFALSVVPPALPAGSPNSNFAVAGGAWAADKTLRPAVFGFLAGIPANDATNCWTGDCPRSQPIPFTIPNYSPRSVKADAVGASSKMHCDNVSDRSVPGSVRKTSARDQCLTGSVGDSEAFWGTHHQRCLDLCNPSGRSSPALVPCDCVDICEGGSVSLNNDESFQRSYDSVFGTFEWDFSLVGPGKCDQLDELNNGDEIDISFEDILNEVQQDTPSDGADPEDAYSAGTTAFAYNNQTQKAVYYDGDWINKVVGGKGGGNNGFEVGDTVPDNGETDDDLTNWQCWRRQSHQLHVWGSNAPVTERVRIPSANLAVTRYEQNKAVWSPQYGLGGDYKSEAAAVDLCEARIQDIDVSITCANKVADIVTHGPAEVPWSPLRYPKVKVWAELPSNTFQSSWSFIDWPRKNDTQWAGRNKAPIIYGHQSREASFYPILGKGDYTLRIQTSDGCGISSGLVTVKAVCSRCDPSVQIQTDPVARPAFATTTIVPLVRAPSHANYNGDDGLFKGLNHDDFDVRGYDELQADATNGGFLIDSDLLNYQWSLALGHNGGVKESGDWIDASGPSGQGFQAAPATLVEKDNFETTAIFFNDRETGFETQTQMWTVEREATSDTVPQDVTHEDPWETSETLTACADIPIETITDWNTVQGLNPTVRFADDTRLQQGEAGCWRWARKKVNDNADDAPFEVQNGDGDTLDEDSSAVLNQDGGLNPIFGTTTSKRAFTASRVKAVRLSVKQQSRRSQTVYTADPDTQPVFSAPFVCEITANNLNTVAPNFQFEALGITRPPDFVDESKYSESTWFSENFGQRACLGSYTTSVTVEDEFQCNSGSAATQLTLECEKPPQPRLGAPAKVIFDYANQRFNWMQFDTRGTMAWDGSTTGYKETLYLKEVVPASRETRTFTETGGFFSQDEDTVDAGLDTGKKRTNLFQSDSTRIICTSDAPNVAGQCNAGEAFNGLVAEEQQHEEFTGTDDFRIAFRPPIPGIYKMAYLLSDGCAYAEAVTESEAVCLGEISNKNVEYQTEDVYADVLDGSDDTAMDLAKTPPRCFYDDTYRPSGPQDPPIQLCQILTDLGTRTSFAAHSKRDPVKFTAIADSPALMTNRGGRLSITWTTSETQDPVPDAVCAALVVRTGTTTAWASDDTEKTCNPEILTIVSSEAGRTISRDFEDYRKFNLAGRTFTTDPIRDVDAIVDADVDAEDKSQTNIWYYALSHFLLTPEWAPPTGVVYQIDQVYTDGCETNTFGNSNDAALGTWKCPPLEIGAFEANADEDPFPLAVATSFSSTVTLPYETANNDPAVSDATGGVNLRVYYNYGVNDNQVSYEDGIWAGSTDDVFTDYYWFLSGVTGSGSSRLAQLFDHFKNGERYADGYLPLAYKKDDVYSQFAWEDYTVTDTDGNNVAAWGVSFPNTAFPTNSIAQKTTVARNNAPFQIPGGSNSQGEAEAINIPNTLFAGVQENDSFTFKVIAKRGCSWSEEKELTVTINSVGTKFCLQQKLTATPQARFIATTTASELTSATPVAITLQSGNAANDDGILEFSSPESDDARFTTAPTLNAGNTFGIRWTGYDGALSFLPGVQLNGADPMSLNPSPEVTDLKLLGSGSTLTFTRKGTYTFQIYGYAPALDLQIPDSIITSYDSAGLFNEANVDDLHTYVAECITTDSQYQVITLTVNVVCAFNPITSGVSFQDWVSQVPFMNPFYYNASTGGQTTAATIADTITAAPWLAFQVYHGRQPTFTRETSGEGVDRPIEYQALGIWENWLFELDGAQLGAGPYTGPTENWEEGIGWYANTASGAQTYQIVLDDRCNDLSVLDTKTITVQCKSSDISGVSLSGADVTFAGGDFPLSALNPTGGLFSQRDVDDLDPFTFYTGVNQAPNDFLSLATSEILPFVDPKNIGPDAKFGGVFPDTAVQDPWFGGGPSRYYLEYVWRVLEAPTEVTQYTFQSLNDQDGGYGQWAPSADSEFDGDYPLDAQTFDATQWKNEEFNQGDLGVVNGFGNSDDDDSVNGRFDESTEDGDPTPQDGYSETVRTTSGKQQVAESVSWVELYNLRDDPDDYGRNTYFRGHAPAAFYPDLPGTYKVQLEVRDGCIEQTGKRVKAFDVVASCGAALSTGVIAQELSNGAWVPAGDSAPATAGGAPSRFDDGSSIPLVLDRKNVNMVVLDARDFSADLGSENFKDETYYFWQVELEDKESTDDRKFVSTREFEISGEKTSRLTIRFASFARGDYKVTLRRTDGCQGTEEIFTLSADCPAAETATFVANAETQITASMSNLGDFTPVHLTSDADCAANLWHGKVTYSSANAIFDSASGMVDVETAPPTDADDTPASVVTTSLGLVALLLAYLF